VPRLQNLWKEQKNIFDNILTLGVMCILNFKFFNHIIDFISNFRNPSFFQSRIILHNQEDVMILWRYSSLHEGLERSFHVGNFFLLPGIPRFVLNKNEKVCLLIEINMFAIFVKRKEK